MPVDAAVAEARKAVGIEVANTVEWRTPVLYYQWKKLIDDYNKDKCKCDLA